MMAASGRLICRACLDSPPAFAACRAYGPYHDPLRRAVHAVKYDGKRAAIPALADLLATALVEEPALAPARVIVPVPLHPRRRRQRGFNQAELLARALAAATGRAVRTDLLRKVRHTRPQVGLSAAGRRDNLRDAFVVAAEPLPLEPLLLVDDVVTTGSTFHECARVLRAAGATAVCALALAHD